MSCRKVEVKVTVKLQIRIDDDVSVGDIMDEMDYSFVDTTESANVEDTEITNFEVIDSK
jgi:hypothetical protein